MAYSFQIISARLLVTNVRVDRSVSSSSSKVLPVSKRNVLAITALVALRKSEINDINRVFCLVSATDQKVVRLDISMDDSFLVHDFDSHDHLDSDVQHSLEVKSS